MYKLGNFDLLLIFYTLLEVAYECSAYKFGVECDPLLFYSPYVKVRRKRNGGDIEFLDRTGFLDLSFFIQAVLCVNGPAVILSDLHEIENGTTLVHKFSKGDMKVYNHECMRINKISEVDINKIRSGEKKPRITADVKVLGVKAAGIQLVGEAGDYRKATAVWFHDEKFGHVERDDKVITDGSFAIVGNAQSFCLDVSKEFEVTVFSKAMTNVEVCTWTIREIDEHYERYKKIFRSNRVVSEYEWDDCSAPVSDDVTTTSTTTNTPITHAPFAIINPNPFKIPKPSSRTTKKPKLKPEIRLQYRVDAENCKTFPEIDTANCTSTPIIPTATDFADALLFFQVLLIDMTLSPPSNATAGTPTPSVYPRKFEDELKWKSEILNLIAEIFHKICEPFPEHVVYTIHRVLELYLVKAHEEDAELTPPKLRKKMEAPWDIIVNDLSICHKNTKHHLLFAWNVTTTGSSTYSRVKRSAKRTRHLDNSPESSHHFENILKKHHHKRQNHHHHHHHHHNSQDKYYQPIEFLEWESDTLANTRYKKASRHKKPSRVLSRSTSRKHALPAKAVPLPLIASQMYQEYYHRLSPKSRLFLSYPIDTKHIRHSNKAESDIFYYDDTAEMEYELNIGIDLAWKIWATVAGFCNQHYFKRQSETFPRFFNRFFEDFLEPLVEKWKFAEDNEQLRYIFSRYNSETDMRWLDTCLEAAYIDSNTKTFRPPRPVLVEGRKADLQVPNNFLDLPFEQMARFYDMPFSTGSGRVFMTNAGSEYK